MTQQTKNELSEWLSLSVMLIAMVNNWMGDLDRAMFFMLLSINLLQMRKNVV